MKANKPEVVYTKRLASLARCDAAAWVRIPCPQLSLFLYRFFSLNPLAKHFSLCQVAIDSRSVKFALKANTSDVVHRLLLPGRKGAVLV
jgi:hypothetical protein